MFSTQKRHAFTMIELLLVIVILGIVGGFALEAIRQYYEGIFRNGEYTRRVATADHVLEQMSKYFENAISSSIVNIDRNAIGEGTCKVPELTDLADNFTIAFVGVDHDSLRGSWDAAANTYLPGWNEDVNVSGATITQTGANYDYANTIITSLFPNSDINHSAIYNNGQSATNNGACSDFNWNLGGGGKFLPITATATTITTDRNLSDENKQRAYLLRSAYAFRVSSAGDLILYSDFRPWNAERYNTAANRKESLLAQNVAHIYADYDAQDFQSNPGLSDRGMVWRLKVCMRGIDQDLSESNASSNDICREKRVHVRY